MNWTFHVTVPFKGSDWGLAMIFSGVEKNLSSITDTCCSEESTF